MSRNTRGKVLKLQRDKKNKIKEEKNLEKTQNRSLNKKEEKVYKASLKKGKTYTKAQLRFKEREAKGLSGLTGGKKGETIAEYRARQKKSVQDAAKKRNTKFKEEKKNKNELQKNTKLTKFQKRRKARTGRY